MKQLFGLLISILIAGFTSAQVPQKFSFQGVARDASNKVVANQAVSLRISIRVGTVIGETVYRETHSTQTSASGVFNISIGGGSAELGQIDQIDWAGQNYILQTEMDVTGGGNYVNLGGAALLSVPYAIQSSKSEESAESQHAIKASEADRWKNFDPVIQEGHFGYGSYLSEVNWENFYKMMWYPRRAAFRFGAWTSDQYRWLDSNIGNASFAGGMNTLADGDASFAFGSDVKAVGNYAVSLGNSLSAEGYNSLALGGSSKALAQNSMAIGYRLESRSRYGVVFGISNDVSDNLNEDIEPTQRIFQLGNGEEQFNGARSNAMTILRNGNVGIGNNVLMPTHILDVGHRMRLRSNANGMTAGLWLDNSNHVPYSFVGGYDDNQTGVYFENAGWKFLVNKNGNAILSGTLTQNSDFRLKRDIVPLSSNFEKLSSISGRHYYWKDPQRHQGLQTGLIAQEVEEVFPELVETDKDGFKSVNYIGLIPHLLEAVKELKRENARLGSENEKLASDAAKWADLQTRIEAIEASLVHSQATSSK